MPKTINRTESHNDSGYKGREFAEAPATLNAKCYPGHTELSWYTGTDISEMISIVEGSVDDGPFLNDEVSACITGTGIPLIDDTVYSIKELARRVPKGNIPGKRCQFDIDQVKVVWANRKEPRHKTLRESGARESLPHHITLRGPPGVGQTIDVAYPLYIETGDPALSEEQKTELIEKAWSFIESCDLQTSE